MRTRLTSILVALALTAGGTAGVAAQSGVTSVDALIEQGSEALIAHDFVTGLELGREARALAPASSQPLAIIVDALIELGRYDEAGEALDTMLRTRPDLSSYARLSYFHEVHGRIDLAIDAMERALVAGGPTIADTEFARVHLAHLLLLDGRIADAAELYRTTLRLQPDDHAAMAGLARAHAAGGDLDAAASHLITAISIDPLPEYVLQLADIRWLSGDGELADAGYAVAAQLERGHVSTSTAPEPYSAIVETDHGDPAVGLTLAKAAYAAAPTIGAADALAWALLANGDPDAARDHARAALATGTRSPLILFHAGVIEAAVNDPTRARALLEQSLAGAAAASPGLARHVSEAISDLSRV